MICKPTRYSISLVLIGLFFLGCGGRNSGNSVGPSPEAPAGSPDEIQWTACAVENEICRFNGTANVRYGVNDVFVIQAAAYTKSCSNTAFGIDPVPGVVKLCEYSNLTAAPPVDNSGWIFCADENGFCDFTGQAEVRYGIEPVFFRNNFVDGVNCSNQVFGDPLYGIVKKCEYRPL